MHDQIGVRQRDRVQDVEKEPKPLFDAQSQRVAMAVDRLPLDVLEQQIRRTARRHAGVNQMCDVRMRQPGEDVPFAAKPLLAGVAEERGVEQLDRRLAFESSVAAPGEPDGAHAPLTDRRHHGVAAEGLSDERGNGGSKRRVVFEEALFGQAVRFREQQLEVCGERRIREVQRREPRGPIVARHLQRLVEKRAPRFPLLPLHG